MPFLSPITLPRFSGTYILPADLSSRKQDASLQATIDAYLPQKGPRQKPLAAYREDAAMRSEQHARTLVSALDELLRQLRDERRFDEMERVRPLHQGALLIRDTLLAKPDASQHGRVLETLLPIRKQLRAMHKALPPRGQGVKAGALRHARVAAEDLYNIQAGIKSLRDLNLLTADGITRDRVYYASPAALPDLMRSRWGTDVADVLVVGAGPAGLSTGLHAVHAGLKTLVVEAGFAAQTFSDQFMQAVHVMRTNAERSSLTNPETSPPELHARYRMAARLSEFRVKGAEARKLSQQLGAPPLIGSPPEPSPAASAYRPLILNDSLPERIRDRLSENTSVPVARNELFQYLDSIVDAIAENPNGIVQEQTPLLSVRKRQDGLFELKSAQGHVLLGRNLVLAYGSVGPNAENIRKNTVLARMAKRDPGHFVALWDRNDLAKAQVELSRIYRKLKSADRLRQRLVIADPLLGSREVSDIVSVLPRGSRSMVVGGGESGAKGVIELFNLNPHINVDWLVEEMPRGEQLQVPAANAGVAQMQKCLEDPRYALETIREWKQDFGVPITPQTRRDLEQKVREGRLRIHELGAKFDGTSVILVPRGQGVQVFRNPFGRELHYGYRPMGEPMAVIDGIMVSAIGYDRGTLRQDPLQRDLLSQGLIRLNPHGHRLTAQEIGLSENGLCSAQEDRIYTVGAGNLGMAADSAIFGMPVRAALVVQDIQRKQGWRYRWGKRLGFISG